MSVLSEGNRGRDPRVLVKCLVRPWLLADASCHLHSTDTPEFCEEEDEEDDAGGSASVSMTAAVRELEDGEDEDEDEEEAATVPGEAESRFTKSVSGRWRTAAWASLTFPFLLLHAFSPSVNGGHLRFEGEVVVPDVLELLLKKRDPLQTAHLLQVRCRDVDGEDFG